MNNNGVFSFAVIFFVVVIVLLIIFAMIIPIMIQFNSKVWPFAEKKMLDANESLAKIQDPVVRNAAVSALGVTYDSIPTNQDTLEIFFQYSWVLVIVVVLFMIFIWARQNTESGGLG